MKAIVCEMCNGNDVVKQGDLYVCQSCGTKYEPEAAKKLMVEVDNTTKLGNLYTLARRAKDDDESEKAEQYYSEILEHNPDDWEAYFYSSYFKASNTTVANIAVAAGRLANAIPTAIELLEKADITADEKIIELKLIGANCINLVDTLMTVSFRAYGEFMKIGLDAANEHKPECDARLREAMRINAALGDSIEKTFVTSGKPEYDGAKKVALIVWERYVADAAELGSDYHVNAQRSVYVDKIRKYKPDYQQPTPKAQVSSGNGGGGCYVATAVYGSYDCPQVWTLRRYRDYKLAESAPGRAFIKTYYAISPTIVKLFGDTAWFKAMWRGKLDRMVDKLNGKGYADTPYNDKAW